MTGPSGSTNRRGFLGYAALVGVGAVSGGRALRFPGPGKSFDRGLGSVELDEATVAGLQADMQAGRLTARQLVENYLDRITRLDGEGPQLHSIIETNPDALSVADELDRERKAQGPRGPLHGIPVLLKDNIDTADRMTTTAARLNVDKVKMDDLAKSGGAPEE